MTRSCLGRAVIYDAVDVHKAGAPSASDMKKMGSRAVRIVVHTHTDTHTHTRAHSCCPITFMLRCPFLMMRLDVLKAQQLQLKEGAQVMLTVNLPNLGLCNGSCGIVIGFKNSSDGGSSSSSSGCGGGGGGIGDNGSGDGGGSESMGGDGGDAATRGGGGGAGGARAVGLRAKARFQQANAPTAEPVPTILFTSGVSGAATKVVDMGRISLPFDGVPKAYRKQVPLKLAWVSDSCMLL